MEQDNSRREFLKRAGTVAWVVPTIQVVNMTAAMAGGDGGGTQGSVVDPTMPPPPPPPQCSCTARLTDTRNGDAGLEWKIELALHNCPDADNVSIGINGAEPDNYPLMPYYWLEYDGSLPATVSLEVHDNQGRILTTCHVDLEEPAV